MALPIIESKMDNLVKWRPLIRFASSAYKTPYAILFRMGSEEYIQILISTGTYKALFKEGDLISFDNAGILKKAFDDGEEIIIREEPVEKEGIIENPASFFCVPIPNTQERGGIFGYLAVYSYEKERPWEGKKLNILRKIAGKISEDLNDLQGLQ